MLTTALTELLDIDYPILQGGMAWVATAELVVGVSEGGGLGILGAGNAPVDWVKSQLERIRNQTSKPYGVNVPLLSPFVEDVIQLCIQERVPVVTTGAGNPTPYIRPLREAGTIVMPVIASVALARRMERAGAHAVIAEGAESGGHIGTVTTMVLVPQVVDALEIPVVAAGGMGDGRALVAALALGAAGIQMGTRFICAQECIAHENYKQAIVRASERSTMVTGASIGHPVRCIRNPMARDFQELERKGASEEEIMAFGTDRLRQAVVEGDVTHGSLIAGQVSGLVQEVLPAHEILRRTMAEAETVMQRIGSWTVQQRRADPDEDSR